jgi:hypothetical protein
METHQTHEGHGHSHGAGCGHTAVRHGDHTDYVHDGHLHRSHADHVDECALPADVDHPTDCTPSHACGKHASGHAHGPDCGHEALPHADHTDYIVSGHLHHTHGSHCDDHGAVK